MNLKHYLERVKYESHVAFLVNDNHKAFLPDLLSLFIYDKLPNCWMGSLGWRSASHTESSP